MNHELQVRRYEAAIKHMIRITDLVLTMEKVSLVHFADRVNIFNELDQRALDEYGR